MGSVLGTIKDVVDTQREAGLRIGALGITSFRPFPMEAVRTALRGARQVVVVEKSFSAGFGGVLATDVAMALSGLPVSVATVVAGLGGRIITKTSLQRVFTAAARGELPQLTFLDLNEKLVEGELGRMAQRRRSGPTAENILRDLGTVASGTADGGPLLPGRRLCRRESAGEPGRSHDPVRGGALELAHVRPSGLSGLRRSAGRVLRPRRRHAGHRGADGRGQRDRLSRGVLHPVPRDVVADRVAALVVRERTCGGDRRRGRAPRERQNGDESDRASRRRRDGRYRVRVPFGHVRAQR